MGIKPVAMMSSSYHTCPTCHCACCFPHGGSQEEMLEQLYPDGTKFHECGNKHSWITNQNGEIVLVASGTDAESLSSNPRIENAFKPKPSEDVILTGINCAIDFHEQAMTQVGIAHRLRSHRIPAIYDPVSGKVKVTNGNLSFTDSLDSAIRYYSWAGIHPLPPEVPQLEDKIEDLHHTNIAKQQVMQSLLNNQDPPKKKNYIEDETTRAIDLNEE